MFELCKIKIQELRLYPNDKKDTVGEVQWAAIALGTSSAVRWLHGLLTCDWIGASIVPYPHVANTQSLALRRSSSRTKLVDFLSNLKPTERVTRTSTPLTISVGDSMFILVMT